MAKGKRKLRFFIAVIIFILVFIYWDNNSLQVSRYTLYYDDLPDEFDNYRIVQISDMHGKTFGKNNSYLAYKVKKLEPDILVATGDMMSSNKDDGKAFLDFLDQFGNECPVYMSMGNHEQIARWLNGIEETNILYENFISEVKKRGVIVLDNESLLLSNKEADSNDHPVYLSGLTIELYHYSRRDLNPGDESLYLKTSYISGVLGEPKGFTIILAHNPAYFREYAEWGADLVLSGHVHGGVIQVPFKGGLLSPERVFFPEFDAGLFEEGGSKMIVNRGLGYSQINFRLFNRPEISMITLKKGNG